MINTAATLKTFFSGFDIPAYAEDSVPDNINLPYITYPLREPEWNSQSTYFCQIWYKKKQLEKLLQKADQVVAAIGEGLIIDQTEGMIVLYPSTPLIQILTDEDSQRAYINLIMNAYHTAGN